jgi:hypothetical protein
MVLHSSQLLLQATVPVLSSYPNRRAYFVSFRYLLTDNTTVSVADPGFGINIPDTQHCLQECKQEAM